jgi:hypothetical protein
VRFSIRQAGVKDEPFLSEMLYEATMWRPGPRRFSHEEVLLLPEIAVYVGGWGRSGDVGLVAEGNGGDPIGAAWYRFFSEEAPGFGFVNPALRLYERASFRVVRRDKVLTMICDLASAKRHTASAP